MTFYSEHTSVQNNLKLEKSGDAFELTRSSSPTSNVTTTITGTYTSFSNSNGFTRLNVVEKDGASANDQITVVISGSSAAFMSPVFSSSNRILPMIADTDCLSSGTINGNWIRFKQPDIRQSDDPYEFGTLEYSVADGTLNLESRYSLGELTTNQGSLSIPSATCSDGVAAGSDSTQYYTNGNNPLALLDLYNTQDLEGQNQQLFSLPISPIAASSTFNGTYYGFIYDQQSQENHTIKAECTDVNCILSVVTDIENGDTSQTEGPYTLTLDGLINLPSSGFVTGSFGYQAGTTQTISCMVSSSGTKTVACIGRSPNDVNAELNIFLVVDA